MADRKRITASQLRELIHYDPDTGIFTWLPRPEAEFASFKLCRMWNGKAGKKAGTPKEGYIRIKIDEQGYTAHRLAWLYVHGEWPTTGLDHRDGNPANNRIHNLRQASQSQNMANASRRKTNTSGYKGVSWHKRQKRFIARIYVDKKYIHIGCFLTAEDAHAAYVKAAVEHYGEFARVS